MSIAVLAFMALASPTAANGARGPHMAGRMLKAAYGPSVTAYSHSRAIALKLWLPHSVYPRDALVLGQVTVANRGKHGLLYSPKRRVLHPDTQKYRASPARDSTTAASVPPCLLLG
ncbi:MAG TPA: hypothetical protein VG815_14510 [Chloroflexota bacterium]|nr:hypothetical protein [Chloroflexota bacterium]